MRQSLQLFGSLRHTSTSGTSSLLRSKVNLSFRHLSSSDGHCAPYKPKYTATLSTLQDPKHNCGHVAEYRLLFSPAFSQMSLQLRVQVLYALRAYSMKGFGLLAQHSAGELHLCSPLYQLTTLTPAWSPVESHWLPTFIATQESCLDATCAVAT